MFCDLGCVCWFVVLNLYGLEEMFVLYFLSEWYLTLLLTCLVGVYLEKNLVKATFVCPSL